MSYVVIYCLVSNIFLKIIDDKTRYSKNEFMNLKVFFLIFILSFFSFLFIKRIKEYRKYLYIKERVLFYKNIDLDNKYIPDNMKDTIRNYEIYLKLRKIKKRI